MQGYSRTICDGDGIADTPAAKGRPFWYPHSAKPRLVTACLWDFAGSDPQVKGPINGAAVCRSLRGVVSAA